MSTVQLPIRSVTYALISNEEIHAEIVKTSL